MAKSKKAVAETPLMKQYNTIKAKYPDALLLFRVGDFYETFGEDAVKASNILGIVLTKRANGAAAYVELAGFPHHSLDTYLPKLVKAGMRVAICDQLEDPKLTKKIVKRGVTELVTPGVSYNDKVLDNKENNFLASVHLDGKVNGVAFLDISTGEFFVSQGNTDTVDKLLQTFKPSEVVFQKNKREQFFGLFGEKYFINTFEDWVFTSDFTRELLLNHFQTNSFKGFGVEDFDQGLIAAGAALHYLAETAHDRVAHITKIQRLEQEQYVWLDRFTIRNLELIHTPHENAQTLYNVLDKTISPMGARLMKRWVVLPLKDRKPIEERLDGVSYCLENPTFSELLKTQIKKVGDLERLISKVAVRRVNPRELVHIKKALYALEPIKQACAESNNASLMRIAEQLNLCQLIREKLETDLQEDPSVAVAKGNVIREGVSEELDELRQLAYSGKDYLVQIQQREAERTGISSLKIGYNNVFGYYLEVTNVHKDKVPMEWNRKQTLVNCERYITEELKILEQKIIGAEEKIVGVESRLYEELMQSVAEYIQPIQLNASLLAHLDCLYAFSVLSGHPGFVRPELNDGFELEITAGRHPVIESQLPPGEEYIANDLFLDAEKQQLIMITGPNMSGKSALLRQTALIVLMAQMGCYVPAEAARIGIVDKVFTRVGASDNISSGESTFMVEMNETASILNNISSRSLILLDEIGRGTSTYDGISIAWAIAEFLHAHPLYRAKVLFATHYHELNEMASAHPRIKNFHVSVKEVNNKIIFLRKLRPGGSAHSFGIHVAKMAGMPSSVIKRANQLLGMLEKSHSQEGLAKPADQKLADDYQLSFIQLNDPLLEQLKDEILDTDINTLTPVEALMKLNEIKKMLGG